MFLYLTTATFTFACGLFFPPLLIVSALCMWKVARMVRANLRTIRAAEAERHRKASDRELAETLRYFA